MAVVLGDKKLGSEIQELQKRAKESFFKKGDADAQFKLGLMYKRERGRILNFKSILKI